MTKLFLVLFFIFFLTLPVFAQVDTAWVRIYSAPFDKWYEANAVAVDDSGNIYVAGYANACDQGCDYLIIKYVQTQ